MKKVDLYNVLVSPIITEKANAVAEGHNQVVFKVLRSATKADVKYAFEMIFSAKVMKITLLNVKHNVRKFGKVMGKHPDWKKAYICLQPGEKFDLASANK